eukprot:2102565-Pleurochrysis_carterae.AAC.1
MSVDKRGSGLLEAFRVSISQQRYDAKSSSLTAAEAEQQLLLHSKKTCRVKRHVTREILVLRIGTV